jgi:hypothetical protein
MSSVERPLGQDLAAVEADALNREQRLVDDRNGTHSSVVDAPLYVVREVDVHLAGLQLAHELVELRRLQRSDHHDDAVDRRRSPDHRRRVFGNALPPQMGDAEVVGQRLEPAADESGRAIRVAGLGIGMVLEQ